MNTFVWQTARIIRLSRAKPGLMKKARQAAKGRKEFERATKKRLRSQQLREACRKSTANKSSLPPYLARNRWEEELNYKLWITKGARFQAARRCEDKEHAALWTNALLSAYLICVGLIPFFPFTFFQGITTEFLAFATTTLSIFLLTCGLVVATRKYTVQAITFHACALEIGVLYNALRRAKELEDTEAKNSEIKRISIEYDKLLARYPNHQPIDSDVFETTKPAYFKLARTTCFWRKRIYWFHTKALHHGVVAFPIILAAWYFLWGSPPPPPN
ncbi:MAG: SLATT domain-containing protein [Verrucomicrobiae bacterium]|nr:SLATT domain-containing protein [Verrucomicrobiae bacterium]